MFLFLDTMFHLLATLDLFWHQSFISCMILDNLAGFQAPCKSVFTDSPVDRLCTCKNWLHVVFCCCQSFALAIYHLQKRFMSSRYNVGLSFGNFSGLQSGSSYQICSLPWPVQHLPYQVVLYFQHSHYSAVCSGVKLVRHLPDAFCTLQWQLTG